MSEIVAPTVQRILSCPECHLTPLDFAGERVACGRCGWTEAMQGHVLSVRGEAAVASFDQKHQILAEHNHHPVTWCLCYERQCEAVTAAFAPGKVVLDLGCGPEPPYSNPDGAFVVGVDMSMPSLAANKDLDLALHTSAASVPLADSSVDVVVANYVLHHMIGDSVGSTWANVEAAFAEMARVAKPGAEVLVLEICPWAPFWLAERVGWKLARRFLGRFVDFLFWPAKRFEAVGARSFPGARFERRTYTVKWSDTFPPVIGLNIKVPRLLYPFQVCLFRWELPGSG
jgi:SAM-dependent methyltransferase